MRRRRGEGFMSLKTIQRIQLPDTRVITGRPSITPKASNSGFLIVIIDSYPHFDWRIIKSVNVRAENFH